MAANFNTLTSKQKKVYAAIESYIKTNNIPPTVRELGEMIGEKTPGAVQGILNRLEQKGVIRRQIGMARSIQLVHPENTLYADPVYIPEIKKISKRNVNDLLNIYNIVKYQPISPDIVESADNHFLIECPDESLDKSGIKYEDLLLINTNCEIKDGDIVILLYENHVLLRYYFRNENENLITLKADSNLLDREEFEKEEVRIIGKLVSRFCKY